MLTLSRADAVMVGRAAIGAPWLVGEISRAIANAREALEATNGKIAEPAVAIGYAEDQDGLTLSFVDNGPGLPPRARDNLFVAFEGSARGRVG